MQAKYWFQLLIFSWVVNPRKKYAFEHKSLRALKYSISSAFKPEESKIITIYTKSAVGNKLYCCSLKLFTQYKSLGKVHYFI